MKANKFILIAAAAIVAVGCGNGTGSMKPVMGPDSTMVSAPSRGLADSVSYLLGVNYGGMLKNYDFKGLDYGLMVKGMKDMVACDAKPQDSTFASNFKIDPSDMNMTINEYLRQLNSYKVAANSIKEREFLAAKEKEEGVQKTESGLLYKVEVEGGEKPVEKDTVYVHYTGTRPDGSVFDETEPGEASRKFLLNRVIKGWNEGMQLIGEGGKITLYVPSSLGYGERGTQSIDPCTPLTFEITLDSLRHFVPKEKPEADKK